MTDVVGIEFDIEKFNSTNDCAQWIKSRPELSFLLSNRQFRLLSGQAKFLTDERRKVWSWLRVWQPTDFKLERPTRHVAVVRRIGSGTYDNLDLPTPLPTTEAKRKEQEYRRQEAERKRREKSELVRQKRAEKNRLKVPRKPSVKRVIPPGGKGLMRPMPKRKASEIDYAHVPHEELKAAYEREQAAQAAKRKRGNKVVEPPTAYATDEEDPEFMKMTGGVLSPLTGGEEYDNVTAATNNITATQAVLSASSGSVVVI